MLILVLFHSKFETIETWSAIATPVSPVVPNKFTMNLKYNPDKIDIDLAGVFAVLYDDYTNYKIVYNCQELNFVLFTAKSEQAWILTRRLNVGLEDFHVLINELGKFTDISHLTATKQDCSVNKK